MTGELNLLEVERYAEGLRLVLDDESADPGARVDAAGELLRLAWLLRRYGELLRRRQELEAS